MTHRAFCISIDVERDYRSDGAFTTRGIDEGLPRFVELLHSRGVPFDLMVSGEVADRLPSSLIAGTGSSVALGCHGFRHDLGYLNRVPSPTLEEDLRLATERVKHRFGRQPCHFRAPNFSADGRTIRLLEGLGYATDSSVLPGRWVRRWRLISLVDHRNVGEDPYVPDRLAFPAPGQSTLLEVPVAPNRLLPGGPLGLGYLHSHGPESVVAGLSLLKGPYAVFLAHSWEMVDWRDTDPVAPWVPRACSADLQPMERLLDALAACEFLNMDRINSREVRLRPARARS